jgi:hypothetical protein
MPDYIFDMIKIDHQIAAVLLGPLVGAAVGFFITMSKTLPLIIRDTVYCAFLGLLGTLAYTLFKMSLATNEFKNNEDSEEEKAAVQRIVDQLQLNELEQDRRRLIKDRIAKKWEGPISMRTRSQTASL